MDYEFSYLEVPRHKVQRVDAILDKHKRLNCNDWVQTDNDWEIVVDLYKFWITEYPEEYKTFYDSVTKYKNEMERSDGIVKDGDAMLQHQLELPEYFYRFLIAVFDKQESHFDRKFVKELSKRIPLFKVADKI